MIESVTIRPEQPQDIDVIFEVNARAFGSPNEAKLVNALREARAMTLSLVAECEGNIVGHVLFSPVDIDRGDGRDIAMGLGPVAVLPDVQSRGIGQSLIHAGIDGIRAAGYGAMVVLGHPKYYPRFGFKSAAEFGLRWEVPGHDAAFFAMELRPGFLGVRPGIVRYRPEFTAG